MPRLLVLPLTVACLVAASPAAARERWLWPVRGPVIGRFELGPDRFAAGQRRGIDIAAPLGAPVRSACPGRVSFAGTVGASGRVVAVACGSLSATYLHLGRLAVRRGHLVAAGEPVGTVGASGRPREVTPHVSLVPECGDGPTVTSIRCGCSRPIRRPPRRRCACRAWVGRQRSVRRRLPRPHLRRSARRLPSRWPEPLDPRRSLRLGCRSPRSGCPPASRSSSVPLGSRRFGGYERSRRTRRATSGRRCGAGCVRRGAEG